MKRMMHIYFTIIILLVFVINGPHGYLFDSTFSYYSKCSNSSFCTDKKKNKTYHTVGAILKSNIES